MPYLPQAIESALQTDADVEVVILENFSTDGTNDWLATVDDSRVRVVHAPEPSSAGGNWSNVCRLARGTYVKLLCADDFVLPGGLDRQLAVLRAEPETVMVASPRRVVSDSGKTLLRSLGMRGLRGHRKGNDAARRSVLGGSNPFGEPSSVMFRTSALLASLPFTERFPYMTDLDMYVKVLGHGGFTGLTSTDAAFRVNSTSWSADIGRQQLDQHLDWLESVVSNVTPPVSRGAAARAARRIRLRFLARRVFTAVSYRR
jgi:glycosyltransferase involved in cell wall biosynthesis